MKRYTIPIAVLAACCSCAVQAANQTAWLASDASRAKPQEIAWPTPPHFPGPADKPERVTMPVKKSMGAVLPPPEYDKPYAGKLVVVELDSQDAMRRACPNTKFPADYALGCTVKYPDRCVVYIVNEEEMAKTRFTTRVVMRHERGHCNGWSAEHLNSRVPALSDY